MGLPYQLWNRDGEIAGHRETTPGHSCSWSKLLTIPDEEGVTPRVYFGGFNGSQHEQTMLAGKSRVSWAARGPTRHSGCLLKCDIKRSVIGDGLAATQDRQSRRLGRGS